MRPADSGYTLIELLIGLAIAAVLTGFLAVFVYQTLAVTNSGNDRLLVTDDLRAAGTWLTQDGQMADLGTSVALNNTLVLSWTDVFSGANVGYQATYAVVGTELRRGFGVRGSAPVTTTIARHIASPSDVRFQLGGGILTATITATAGSTWDSQQIQVVPRSRQP